MLDQRIGRMRSSKLRLQTVGQVKIINGKHCCRKSMWGMAELFGKSRDLQESRMIRKVECKMEKSSKSQSRAQRARGAGNMAL